MKNKLIIFFKSVNLLIPKNNNKYVFISNPLYSDNCKYLYEYYEENNLEKTIVWLSWKRKDYSLLNKYNFKYYNFFSFKGLFHFVTSKFIFSTHCEGQALKSSNQIYIDLWHGLPLKTIYSLIKGNETKVYCSNVDYRIVPTLEMKEIFEKAFNSKNTKHKIIGQPCNIKLDNKRILSNQLIQPNSKIVLYVPTFRKSDIFDYDGEFQWFSDKNFDINSFNTFLNRENIVIFVKLHPAEEKIVNLENISLSNIIIIKTSYLIDNNLDIYNLLPEIDTLITDYSSIYFDFLLYDKPIIFSIGDIENYKKNRGLAWSDYEQWMPGDKVYYQKELEKALLKKDFYEEERKKVKEKSLGDCKNISKRIFEFTEKL